MDNANNNTTKLNNTIKGFGEPPTATETSNLTEADNLHPSIQSFSQDNIVSTVQPLLQQYYSLLKLNEKPAPIEVIRNAKSNMLILVKQEIHTLYFTTKEKAFIFRVDTDEDNYTTQRRKNELAVLSSLKERGKLDFMPTIYESLGALTLLEYLPKCLSDFYGNQELSYILDDLRHYFSNLGYTEPEPEMYNPENIRVNSKLKVVLGDYGLLVHNECKKSL